MKTFDVEMLPWWNKKGGELVHGRLTGDNIDSSESRLGFMQKNRHV